MVKKLLCLILAAVMLFGVLAMTGCSLFGEKKQDDSDDRLPTTLNFLGITEGSTTPEATAAVEEELNKILVARYKTKIKLTLVTEDELRSEFEKIRQQGYAVDHGEHHENINCVSAPIFDQLGKPVASISISAPSYRFPIEKAIALAPEVISSCRAVSARAGPALPAQAK